MASHAIGWLARRQLFARTVTIKVRYADFTTITRSHTAPPTRDEAELAARAVRLLEKTDAGRRPVRLLGVSVHNFCTDADALAGRSPADRLAVRVRMMTDTWDPAPVRQVPARARAAVLRPARARPPGAGHARRRSRMRHRQADARAARAPAGARNDRHRSIRRHARRQSRRSALPSGLRFEVGTIEAFAARRRRHGYDLIFSNAALHWVEDHDALFGGLARRPRTRRPARLPGAGAARRAVARGRAGARPPTSRFGPPSAAGESPQPVLDAGRLRPAALSSCGFADPNGAADRLSSCSGRPATSRRMDEGHAADRVRAPPAALTLFDRFLDAYRDAAVGAARCGASRSSFRSSGSCAGRQRSA